MTGGMEIPVNVARWFVRVVEKTHLTPNQVRTFAYLASRSDETGAIGIDPDGRPVSDPRSVSKALGIGESTVFVAFTALERAGLIEYARAKGAERYEGVTGRVRLLISESA